MSGTITGLYKLPGGGLAKGSVRIEIANVADQLVRDAAGGVVFQGPQAVKLRNGAFTLTVPASDGSTSPTNLAYRVTEDLEHVDRPHHRTVVFQVADGATVDMADVAGEIEATPVITQPVTLLELQAVQTIAEQAAAAAEAMPTGGASGQVLAKASGDDFDTAWVNPPTGGGSGPVTSGDITDATVTGKAVLTAATSAAARGAIGAGTSSLALGSTSDTAKAGDWKPGLPDLPAGSVVTVYWTGSVWTYAGATIAARPTSRTDITVNFIDPIGGAIPPAWAITGDVLDQVAV